MDRFTATPDPVSPGGTLTVCFTDTAMAGQSVTVDIVNGLPPGDAGRQEDHPDIMLGNDGRGCIEWPVPLSGWNAILLEHPTSDPHGVDVSSPP